MKKPNLLALFEKQHGFCWLCGTLMVLKRPRSLRASRDHVIPACMGGTWRVENIRAAHKACNQLRGGRAEVICLPPPGETSAEGRAAPRERELTPFSAAWLQANGYLNSKKDKVSCKGESAPNPMITIVRHPYTHPHPDPEHIMRTYRRHILSFKHKQNEQRNPPA